MRARKAVASKICFLGDLRPPERKQKSAASLSEDRARYQQFRRMRLLFAFSALVTLVFAASGARLVLAAPRAGGACGVQGCYCEQSQCDGSENGFHYFSFRLDFRLVHPAKPDTALNQAPARGGGVGG